MPFSRFSWLTSRVQRTHLPADELWMPAYPVTAGGLIDLVEIREGDALQTLSVDLPETVDLLLLDGAKALYPEILGLMESRLRAGAFIVADNADDSPDHLPHVRSLAKGCLSTPFGEDEHRIEGSFMDIFIYTKTVATNSGNQ